MISKLHGAGDVIIFLYVIGVVVHLLPKKSLGNLSIFFRILILQDMISILMESHTLSYIAPVPTSGFV